MNHDGSLRELLLIPGGPPEGVWEAAINYAFTSDDETPNEYLASGINTESGQAPDEDTDTEVNAIQETEDQADGVPTTGYEGGVFTTDYEDQEGETSPSPPTSTAGFGPDALDETEEDYGG